MKYAKVVCGGESMTMVLFISEGHCTTIYKSSCVHFIQIKIGDILFKI